MMMQIAAQTLPQGFLEGIQNDLGIVSITIRLALAAALGGLIGIERKMADKPADGRTMMLICVGAAAFVLLGLQISADMNADDATRVAITRIDSTRVLSYIISGIGFLGAGAILHSKKAVKGLTTAAAIWVAAAIGAACGLAKFDTAFVLFAIVLIAMWTPWLYNMSHARNSESDKSSSNED